MSSVFDALVAATQLQRLVVIPMSHWYMISKSHHTMQPYLDIRHGPRQTLYLIHHCCPYIFVMGGCSKPLMVVKMMRYSKGGFQWRWWSLTSFDASDDDALIVIIPSCFFGPKDVYSLLNILLNVSCRVVPPPVVFVVVLCHLMVALVYVVVSR